jgi:hypothetical protein
VTPAKIASASGSAAVTVTVTTTAAVLASRGYGRLVYALCLPGLGLLVAGSRHRRVGSALAGLVLMAAVFTSCGGGGLTGSSASGGGGSGAGLPGTAPGDYSIGVTATPASGGVGHGATLILKVT